MSYVRRITAIATVISLLLSMAACGPSKELMYLQAKYAEVQAAPLTLPFRYNLTQPFYVNGKRVSNSTEFATALEKRPTLVVATANRDNYGELACKADFEGAGYSHLGSKKRGNVVEMTFRENSAPAVQAAQQDKEKKLTELGTQISQRATQETQENQTRAMMGATLGTMAIGIAVPLIMNALNN